VFVAIRPGRRAEWATACLIAGVVCVVLLGGGCASRPARTADEAALAAAQAQRTAALAEGDRLASVGCYQPMRAALDRYAPYLDDRSVRRRAFDVAVALVLRERRLGVYPGQDAAALASLAQGLEGNDVALALEVVDVLPFRRGTRPPDVPAAESFADLRRRVSRLHGELRLRADTHAMAALLLMHLLASHPPASLPPDTPLSGRRFEAPTLETWPWVAPHLERSGVALAWLDVRGATPADEWAVWQLEHPDCDEVFVFIADAELGQRRLASADAALGAAVAALPDLVPARVLRGDIRLDLGDYGEALDQFTAVTARVPEHREAWLGAVQALSHLGRAPEAIAAADRLLALGEWYLGEAHYWKAWNQFQQRALVEARASLEQARPLLHSASVYYLGALIAYREEQWLGARTELGRALDAEPGHCDARFLLGAVHLLEQSWQEAIAAFSDAELCFARSEPALAAAVADVDASALDAARRAALRARRQQALDECVRQQQWALQPRGGTDECW